MPLLLFIMKIKFVFLIIGAGGTGGFFASFLARQVASLTYGDVDIVIVDGDVIESKNISRQPFCENEVGENKAVNLAGKINTVFPNLSVISIPEYIDSSKEIIDILGDFEGKLPVICGCTDNHHARQVMDDAFNNLDTCLYIDSANEKFGGEVVVGAKSKGEVISPQRAHFFPEILESKDKRRSDESCFEKLISGEQLFCTNIMAANIMLMYCGEMLLNGVIKTGITFFDTRDMTMHHANSINRGEAFA